MSEDEELPDLDGGAARSINSTAVSGGGGDQNYVSPSPDQVLENVLENVLYFLTSRHDRNAASLVCKSWFRAEALTRSELFIGNCYSVSPGRVTNRFKQIKAIAIKGKPRFSDFSLLPPDWGAHFANWLRAMAASYRALEKVYLKRMCVTDEDLAITAHSFPFLKELVFVCCEGFGTDGLAIIARECRLADDIIYSFLLGLGSDLILRGNNFDELLYFLLEDDYIGGLTSQNGVCFSKWKDLILSSYSYLISVLVAYYVWLNPLFCINCYEKVM